MATLPTGPFLNAEAIYKGLLSQGFTPNAAAGVAGNIYQESHGNPSAGSPAGGGLFGETLANGGSVNGGSLAEQLIALQKYVSLNGSIADVNAHASSPQAAAAYFMTNYERPNSAYANQPVRQEAAQWVAAAAQSGNWGAGVTTGSSGSGSANSSGVNPANVVTGATSLLSESGTLLHDTAQVLNAFFWLFQPGQQWRLVFGVTGIASLFSAVRLYMSDSSGEKMPLIVLLSGISATAFYMAFRPWPTSGGSSNAPIRPAAYVTDIFSGNVPSSAAKPPNDTAGIEAGLAAFAGVWAVSKTAGALSGIGGTVGGILGLFRNAGTVAEDTAP